VILNRHFALTVLFATSLPLPLSLAEDKQEDGKPRAGHSHQGEAFNEGPRHSALPIEGTGKISFPVQCTWPEGQQFFDQGIGQLHGFWYYEAERTFRQIASHDPKCAMAYWGMAMANWENEKRARAFIKKAGQLKERASEHNRRYIDAQANYLDGEPKDVKKRKQELIDDLESIIQDYPNDIEARAFLCVRLWQFGRSGLPIHSHQAVDAMLQDVFAINPMHPAHHYRIHLWDNKKARVALDSAAKCGHTAPGIAHIWHMPGHIYSKLRRWDDSAFAQEASARIDHKYMITRRVLPDQIHNYAHNNEWLCRNWMNLGRAHDALGMARSLVANPRHPRLNTLNTGWRSTKYGRIRIFEVLKRFELWDETLRLADTPYLEPTTRREEQLKRLRLLGHAHFGKGSLSGVQSVDQEMADLLATASADKKNAEKEAREKAEREKKNEEDTRKMITEAGKKPDEWVNSVKKARQAMSCFVALLGNNPEEAKKHLGAVQGDKYTLARLHLRAGDQKKALSLSEEAVKSGEKRVLPLLARIEILHAINRKDEAREAFDLLKPLSAHLDPQAPPIARVMKIAEEFSLGNWQASPVVRDDVGERPVLDTLGPVAWTPPAAHEFALPNEKGETISRKDYQGRPLVLIFYLGYGCLHCVEQLEEFAHKAELFEKAGFEVLAISTDSEGDLRKAKEKWEKEGGSFPFPLVADPAMHVFREWSAYDDFEKEPLHGTFVISPGGQVLWHDISSEPFMDCEFVVKEGKRLLQLHGRDL
jgi:peroxiredoxin